jgi:hypothetical protein
MPQVHYDSYTEARNKLKNLLDAAENGQVATIRRDAAAALDAAMRSGTSRWAPHTRHQTWMSASLSACLADSMRLVFASCQPAAADNARAVRPASSLISRSRSASCCRTR